MYEQFSLELSREKNIALAKKTESEFKPVAINLLFDEKT